MLAKLRWILIIIVLMGMTPISRADVAPELVDRGKRATALVELEGGTGFGTAFCIDRAGYFVTNYHVAMASGGGKKLILVLYPGEKNQKTLTGEAVRLDKDADLALLRVQKPEGLTVLELGDERGLVETLSVTAFGYPFGKDLAAGAEYPSLTVSTGHITALRKARGELEAIQLDASLNPGNSGGPVVDPKGQVIGVVVTGIRGAGINFAIPVSHLRAFLTRMDFMLTPSRISTGKQRQEQQFVIQVDAFPALAPDTTVELTLSAGPSDERVFRARSVDGHTFRVTAVPVPGKSGSRRLLLTLKDANSTLICSVEDLEIMVGGKALWLSRAKEIDAKGAGQVTLIDGQTVTGRVAGLERIDTQVGGATVKLDLRNASSITVEASDGMNRAVDYRIVARRAGKALSEASGSIAIADGALVENFESPTMDSRLWQIETAGSGPTVTQKNGRLEIDVPAESSNYFVFTAGYKSLWALHGDYDMQVDYELPTWPEQNGVRLGFRLFDPGTEVTTLHRVSLIGANPPETTSMTLHNFGGGEDTVYRAPAFENSGRLKLVRVQGVFTGYYWDRLARKWVAVGAGGSFAGDVRLALTAWSDDHNFGHKTARIVFRNLIVNSGQIVFPH